MSESTSPVRSARKQKKQGATVKHKRRYCRAEGCTKIVKSQGLCQRHGAKTKTCRVPGCPKQAQGNFDKMCKSHFNAAQKAAASQKTAAPQQKTTGDADQPPPAVTSTSSMPPTASVSYARPITAVSVYESIIPNSVGWKPSAVETDMMPLVKHLKDGFDSGKPAAWHRNEERGARGLVPAQEDCTNLERWERELAWMEFLILSGTSDDNYEYLTRAWGTDGFHMLLAQFMGRSSLGSETAAAVPQHNHRASSSSADLVKGIVDNDELASQILDCPNDLFFQDLDSDVESLTGDESGSSGEESYCQPSQPSKSGRQKV